MLKFYCLLTGDQYSMVAEESPKSKQKVMLLANTLMLPIIVWGINGYLLANKVLESSIVESIVVSLFCMLLIFLLERVIILSAGGPKLKKFRMWLGFFTAFLGAIALDEVLFKTDIDQQVNKNREAYAQLKSNEEGTSFDNVYNIQGKLASISAAKNNYDKALLKASDEMDGKGSGVKGLGKITMQKLEIAKERKQSWVEQQQQMDSLVLAKEAAMKSAKEQARLDYKDGLIVRVGALFQLVFSEFVMLVYFIVFTGLMFLLEFIVIIIKSTSEETSYERRLKLIDEVRKRRMDILAGKDSPLSDPGYILPEALAARQALQNKSSLFN